MGSELKAALNFDEAAVEPPEVGAPFRARGEVCGVEGKAELRRGVPLIASCRDVEFLELAFPDRGYSKLDDDEMGSVAEGFV